MVVDERVGSGGVTAENAGHNKGETTKGLDGRRWRKMLQGCNTVHADVDREMRRRRRVLNYKEV